MIGSLASYQAGGFNYTLDSDTVVDNILQMSPTQIMDESAVWQMPGVFNLPIYQPPTTSWSLSEFFSAVSAPGSVADM